MECVWFSITTKHTKQITFSMDTIHSIFSNRVRDINHIELFWDAVFLFIRLLNGLVKDKAIV